MNGKDSPPTQTIENLKGEIEFRAKLARQHVSGEIALPDYFTKEEHDRILLDRVETTRQKMKELGTLGVDLSPFLELGAERGQRSLVLTNEFGASGFAIDISFHQLQTMEHFSKLFNMERLPVRICCNANHLPFKSNCFNFVFCYQFLHHFPALTPIMREVYRVLSNGHFYFAEEPFKRVFKLVFYKQKRKKYSKSSLKKNRYIKLIESFVSEAPCDEVDHGVIENDEISLTDWIEALSLFDEHETILSSINNISSRLDSQLRINNIPNYFLGGLIASLCQKKSQVEGTTPSSILELLGCPDCRINEGNGSFDRPVLDQVPGGFRCSHCGSFYPSRDGILLLLPKTELRQLYPSI